MKKADFEQWKDSPVTKEIFSKIEDAREQYREVCVSYAKSGDSIQAARAAGNIESLDHLLNIEYEGDK